MWAGHYIHSSSCTEAPCTQVHQHSCNQVCRLRYRSRAYIAALVELVLVSLDRIVSKAFGSHCQQGLQRPWVWCMRLQPGFHEDCLGKPIILGNCKQLEKPVSLQNGQRMTESAESIRAGHVTTHRVAVMALMPPISCSWCDGRYICDAPCT